MIDEITRRFEALRDIIYKNLATKNLIIKRIREIKCFTVEYYKSYDFTLKDMHARREILDKINQLVMEFNKAEKEIQNLHISEKDKILDVIFELEASVLTTILSSKVIGEAKPMIFSLKKQVKKILEEEEFYLPEELKQTDQVTQTIFKILFKTNYDFKLSELKEILEKVSEEDIKKSIEKLEKLGYVEIYEKGEDKIIKFVR